MSLFNYMDWIAFGGILIPVGHWTSRPWILSRIRREIIDSTNSKTLYEVSIKQVYNTLYSFSEKFVTSSCKGKRITLSEESNPISTTILNNELEEINFRKNHTISWEKPIKSFPVTVRYYTFPKGYSYHPKTGMISKHSETLLQDIWQIQQGKYNILGGIFTTIIAMSLLFSTMNPIY